MSSPLPEDDLLSSLLPLLEGHSVLYVEDEPQIRAELSEMLGSLFTRVVMAEDGVDAWEKFQKGEFLLVITDINMPRMSGLELIEAIQKVRPHQGILVTSAYSDASHLVPLINLGVGSFLLKPLNWKIFLSLIHKEATAALAGQQDARYQQRLEKEVRIRTEEVREIQQQLIRLQEAKDNMLSLISHELRTPLNGILGFVDLLRDSVHVPEAVAFLSHVEESARRLELSTRKALDFSSLSAGKRSVTREMLSIESLLAMAGDQLTASGADLSVVWEGPPGAELYTDGNLTVEVFHNILENAKKYGGGGRVAVSLTREGVWEVLTFRDSGPGFSPAMLSSAFQPFQTDNVMHHSEGMGLGLALVDVIMLTLGGRVEASNHPEGGALVSLRFPKRSL